MTGHTLARQAKPGFSVIMPAFNAGRFFAPAIRSILEQSYTQFELIIVDDGSTDGTRDVARTFATADARVVLLENERNRGISYSLNRGIHAARADWIARMDADDLSLPGRLEAQRRAAERHPTAALITCPHHLIAADERLICKPRRGICNDPELLPWYLLFYNRVSGGGQVCFPTALAQQLGGFDETDATSQDRDFAVRLLRAGSAVVVDQPLYAWRMNNPHSITKTVKSRYAETSLRSGLREISATCGIDLSLEEAISLRDFWLRFHGGTQDWDAIQRRLLDLADRYVPPRPIPHLRRRLHASIAYGWLNNALRSVLGRRGTEAWQHLRRAHTAAGPVFARTVCRFLRDLWAAGGDGDRLV